MKRAILLVLLAIPISMLPALQAQEHAKPESEEHSGSHEARNLDFFKWINFAILAGAIGWVAYKRGGAFFQARTEEIRRGLAEAARIRKDAEARYAEMEYRLAHIDMEIQGLRERARRESSAEGERILQETQRALAKIQIQIERDIEAAGKAARQRLRSYGAELAVGIARERLQQRLTPEADAGLVATMAADISRSAAREAGVL